MASLTPEASAILKAGRSALRANSADRERVAAALRTQLGAEVLPPKHLAEPIARGAIQRFVPGAAVGVCVLGCALFFALHRPSSSVVARAQVEPQSPAVAASGAPTLPADPTIESAGTDLAPRAASAVALPAAQASSSAAPQQDKLAKEVALLARATSALSAGRPGDALKALNEHQRRFPNGILNEERRAAKAQALCSLGRLSDGRAELAHLAPHSPAASRAKQACDPASSAEQR